MNLDIIAQLVQILKDAPELGAIEVRRGLFGSWSVVRLTKAGHQTNAGAGDHAVGAHGSPGTLPASPFPPAQVGEGGRGKGEGAPPTPMPEAPPSGPTFNFKAAITHMVQRNASDLLLKVGRPATIRVNGELVALESAPLKPEELKSLAEQIMTPRQVKEFAEHKEADFAIGVPGVGRFRTNVYQQRGTVAFAFRSIPYEVKTIRDLNLPPVLEEIAIKPRGLVLVTGVTGSGKSTALAALVNHINVSRRVNIITIEDPIEFLHRDNLANISQREVGNDTLSFNAA